MSDDYTMLGILLDAVDASHLSFHPISIAFSGWVFKLATFSLFYLSKTISAMLPN